MNAKNKLRRMLQLVVAIFDSIKIFELNIAISS